MSEMVERVARALCRADGKDPDEIFEYKASSDPGDARRGRAKNWALYIDDARVAIEAMRQPTEAMIRAGGEFEVPNGWHNDKIDTYAAEGAWLNMIDAALK